MNVLFITTFGQSIIHEHIFTRNVWYALRENPSVSLMTIFEEGKEIRYDYDPSDRWHKLYLPSAVLKSRKDSIQAVAECFKRISPDIIHSNMIEIFEIEAANKLKIPIVLTMHIGGLICPRGGGNGFLRWDDTICDGPVGDKCRKCCYYELPFPYIAELIDKLIPQKLSDRLNDKLKGKRIFYLSPILSISENINRRLEATETLKKATVITANNRLSSVLKNLGIPTEVIRHGIKSFNRYDYPKVEAGNKVKFYFLGRMQYSKGLHILLQALEGIPIDSYELHVFGDAYPALREQIYKKKILKLAKHKSVIFHGFVENNQLPELLKGMHVMVHPAIFHEVYGINISESLSFGHPVLATKCGGPEMQIQNDVNGWLIEPNNVIELRKKIKYIIDNKSILPQINANCHCPNTLDNYVGELYKLYGKLLNMQ